MVVKRVVVVAHLPPPSRFPRQTAGFATFWAHLPQGGARRAMVLSFWVVCARVLRRPKRRVGQCSERSFGGSLAANRLAKEA